MKMSYIYALKLEQDKYYVGKTNNPELRIDQHVNGNGSTWTTKYKPIELLFIKPLTSPFDEDIVTKELMVKYGIDFVRGGSYCGEFIDEAQQTLLIKEIRTATNACFKCGSTDHFINDCKQIKIKLKKIKKYKQCKRCNRIGHTKSTCYANTKIDGTILERVICKKCNRYHGTKKCNFTIIKK